MLKMVILALVVHRIDQAHWPAPGLPWRQWCRRRARGRLRSASNPASSDTRRGTGRSRSERLVMNRLSASRPRWALRSARLPGAGAHRLPVAVIVPHWARAGHPAWLAGLRGPAPSAARGGRRRGGGYWPLLKGWRLGGRRQRPRARRRTPRRRLLFARWRARAAVAFVLWCCGFRWRAAGQVAASTTGPVPAPRPAEVPEPAGRSPAKAVPPGMGGAAGTGAAGGCTTAAGGADGRAFRRRLHLGAIQMQQHRRVLILRPDVERRQSMAIFRLPTPRKPPKSMTAPGAGPASTTTSTTGPKSSPAGSWPCFPRIRPPPSGGRLGHRLRRLRRRLFSARGFGGIPAPAAGPLGVGHRRGQGKPRAGAPSPRVRPAPARAAIMPGSRRQLPACIRQ